MLTVESGEQLYGIHYTILHTFVQVLKISYDKKLKTKTLSNFYHLLFNLQSTVQVSDPSLGLSLQILRGTFSTRLQLGWGVEGRPSLRMVLPSAIPLTLSPSKFISVLFSGLLGTFILSLIMAFPISQLVGSACAPDTESFI